MTNIDLTFLDSTIALKLALSLGHFLWQGILIALLAFAAGSVARKRSHWQYAANVAALLLMAACLPLNLLWVGASTEEAAREKAVAENASPPPNAVLRPSSEAQLNEQVTPVETRPFGLPSAEATHLKMVAQETEAVAPIASTVSAANTKGPIGSGDGMPEVLAATAPASLADSVTAQFAGLAPSLVLAWLAGVALLLLRLLFATSRGCALRREASPVAESILETSRQLARQLGIRRDVFVGCCESIAVPVAVGILRPAILFPSAVLTGLTPDQVELVLLHELSHFRRRDHLVVVLQRLVETLLFFHPAAWLVSRQVSIQREHCCDADVVNSGAGPVAYANCLLRIAEIQSARKSAHAVTLASDGHRPSQLRSRVSRILGVPDPARGRFTLSGILAVLILLGGCLWSLTRETAVAETGDAEPAEPAASRDENDPQEQPPVVPEVVSFRPRLKDASGKPVAVSKTDFERVSRGYANAASNPPKLKDEALRLSPGKQQLVWRPDSLSESTLIDLDLPPRDSAKSIQLRKRSPWSGNDKVQLKLEAQVYEREFGNNIRIKFKNTGEEDFTFVRSEIQFVTSRWRIIPTEASNLDGYTLKSGDEHSHGFSWSSAIRHGLWIPRNHEEIIEDRPVPEPGKIHVELQIGPTRHPNILKVEDPDFVIARDERYRRDGKVSVELDKKEFVLGENVLLHYSVKNEGEEPLLIYVGGDYRGSPRSLRFKVHAYDEAGKRLADPHPNPWNMGGLGTHPELKSGETYWLSIPLTRYVQFDNPGTYRLRVFHDLGWNEHFGIPDTIDNSMPKRDTVAPIVETTIRFRDPSPKDAQRVVDAATKPRPESYWGHRTAPYGDWAAMRHPVYLPLLLKVAKAHEGAIATIASIPTPEATDALIRLAANGSSVAASLLPGRLPHPNFQQRENWNEAWSLREQLVKKSWRNEFADRARQVAWQLLEAAETEPYEDRKKDWMLGGSILFSIGRSEDFTRFVTAGSPIVESLGTVAAEQQQYPSPLTVIANFVSAGDQLIRRGGRPGDKPQTAFESMMFVAALRAADDFRPDGWQTLARRLMRHSMPRVRSTCVASLPVPIEQQFVDPIIGLFSDSSPLVAATALNSAGAAKDSRFLEAALKTSREAEDKWVQGAARHAAGNCRPVKEPKRNPVDESARSSSAKTDSSARKDAAKESRLNLLQAQITVKQAELERAKVLFKRGFVTKLEVKKLELELASLTKTLAAEKDVSQAEKLLQEADAKSARRLKAEARLEMLEAQSIAKRAALDRAKQLFKQGLINRREVEKLEFELQTIRAAKEAEEQLLDVERQFKAAEEAAEKTTLKVKLTGESIAGFPLLFQLDVTNGTKKPFEYWCGGPGLYPNASMFVAEITDSDGKSEKVVLHNGQYVEGSGVNRKVEKEASLPAACDPLPPGKYTITVSCGQTAVLAGALHELWPEMKSAPITIEIRDEPQAIERANDALLDLSAKSPFAKHVARTYGIAPVVNEWLQQLLNDDPQEAFKVVGSLSRCRRLPKGGDEIVVRAAKKHLSPFRQEKNLLRYISMIARNVGNATTLEATMAIALGDVDNYARRGAVNDLAEFSHPVAEKVLEKLAENPDSPVYWSAIEALATKKNRLALKALLDTPEPENGDRRRYFATMLKNFPDNPAAQKAIQQLLNPNEEKPQSGEDVPEAETGDSAGDISEYDSADAAADAVTKSFSKVPWSKPVNGLRVRTFASKTSYRLGDVLPLHAQLQNATQEPIPFSKLSRQCRVRVNDAEGNWVGIARDDFDISPWEGRTGELKPGEIIQWTMNLERRRFNKTVKPGSTLPVTVSVPSQIIEPGKLPRTEYSRPVRIRFDQVPGSTLKASDLSDNWSRQTTIVYREMGGLFGASRALRIDGSGLLTAVRPESRNPPKEPLLPLGRTTMQLPQERLNRISKLLSEADLKSLGKKTRIANPDEPVFLLSISVGGRTLSGAFPWGVVRDSADLTAIQKELREVMTFVKSNAEQAAAQADQLTKTRREKLLANADSFMLQLYYYGPTNKPYYRLHLQTQPVEPTNFFTRSHQLSRKQLEKLLDGLARERFLQNGNDSRPPELTYKEGYILYLSCKDYQQYEVLGFADNKEMLKRLIGLHPSLEGDAARSMSLLLGRMEVRPEELPKTEPVKPEPLPKTVRLRVYMGDPKVGDAAKPIIDQPIETDKPFDLKGGYITVAGKLFRAVTGRPRFKATLRYNGGTNEFDAEIKLGKPLRSYGGGFSGGILTHFVRLDPVEKKEAATDD